MPDALKMMAKPMATSAYMMPADMPPITTSMKK
jgi:hypothetical protein